MSSLALCFKLTAYLFDRVATNVVYVPITTPACMPPRRQIAYRQKEIPPNPKLDPDGWKQLSPVSITGTYLHHKTVTVHYSLYLAMPVRTPYIGSVLASAH